MKKVVLFAFLFLQCACTNNFEKFYVSTNSIDFHDNETTDTISPKLYISNFADAKQDANKLMTDNYVLLGYSSFYSPSVKSSEALEFGKKINADIVMLYQKHKDTVNSTVPITTPTYSTVNTSYYSPYGGYGYANSTINGSRTTYYTSTVDRYDYYASYWKQNPNKLRFGIHFEALTDQLRQSTQSNKGLLVTVVVKDSPAFKNDILVGDIITEINGQAIYHPTDYATIMDKIPEQTSTEFKIIRNGKTIKKNFKL